MNYQNSSAVTATAPEAVAEEYIPQPTEVGAETPPTLLRYWNIVVRRKWIIVAIVSLALAIALIITLFTTPQYTATATIEIARQRDQVVNIESVEPKAESQDLEFYQTQYSLLRARSIAERVVGRLQLTRDDSFFDQFDVDLIAGGVTANLSRAEQVQRRLELAARVLLAHVSVSPTRGSRLVDLSFTSPDRFLSQRVVQAWTQEFIAANLQRRFEASAYARRFLESRLGQVRQRLEESERLAVNYAANQQIITIASNESGAPNAPRQERPLIAEQLVILNQELQRAIAERIRAQSRGVGGGGVAAEALTNDTIARLRQRRAELQADYANLMTRFEPGYPPARAIASQIGQLERSLRTEEARILASFRATDTESRSRETALRQQVDQLKAALVDQRRRSIQFNIYQRDVDTNRELYAGLLQRYREIGVAGGVGTNNISIVDQALVPLRPSSPKLASNLALALLGGIVLAFIVAFILEQVDEAISDPADIQRAIRLPLIGTIPRLEGADQDILEILNDRKSAISEAYLSAQSSLHFSTDHGFPRSIAVTSTRAGEGKSTTAFALAQLLARMDKRVVLVDADMRSPSVNRLFNIPNDMGLSNYLSGEDDLSLLLASTNRDRLMVLPAGPTPPSAAELLSGPRLETLLQVLRESFDHIIVDAPPILGLADGPLIGRRVEGVLFTVESGGATKRSIRAALQRLEAVNAAVLGIVLTKFDASKLSYGYGYEYGYGYGQREQSA